MLPEASLHKAPRQTNYFPYCKRISANVKRPSASYTYAFYSTKKHPRRAEARRGRCINIMRN
ncbi:hypothetical protein OBV_27270 [Oscillibacter valericigenes Sjm18-20]|nr:hypothetical protein OBV_27270 [Oscillibacter valericigenes Sjm18-20]